LVTANFCHVFTDAGWLMVTVWQQAAIVRVELQDASGTEQHNSSSTSLSRQDQDAATSMQPLRVSVELECLQISVWDDERSRLLGPAPVEKAHSRKQQFTTQPGAREAFCFSVDALSLLLSRAKHSGIRISICHTALCVFCIAIARP
jgi:hypothetical protein